MNSTDVVRYFKYNLPRPIIKIGHIGTLDPFAEGLLMIGVNGAQKANDFIHENGAKTYLAHGVFGISTTTGDHTGEVVGTNDLSAVAVDFKNINLKEFNQKLKNEFVGEYFQKPHKVSAVKVKGKRLYDYEREGIAVEIKPVRREIYDLEIVEFDFPRIIFRAKVSSGTYIRVLFEEMAAKYHLFGHLTKLVREGVGEIGLECALTKEEWPIKGEPFDSNKLVPITQVLKFPKILLSDHHRTLFRNGVRLRVEQIFAPEAVNDSLEGQRFWLYDGSEELLGLIEIQKSESVHLYNFRG